MTTGAWPVPRPTTKDTSCEMSSDLVDRNQPGANALARLSVTTDKDGKQVVGFTLPFGVALEAGMGLRLGKEPVKVYQYRTCNQVGCIATTPFDDNLKSALNTALKNGDDASVMFAGLDGKPVAVPVSFKGYQKSLGAWRAAEGRASLLVLETVVVKRTLLGGLALALAGSLHGFRARRRPARPAPPGRQDRGGLAGPLLSGPERQPLRHFPGAGPEEHGPADPDHFHRLRAQHEPPHRPGHRAAGCRDRERAW